MSFSKTNKKQSSQWIFRPVSVKVWSLSVKIPTVNNVGLSPRRATLSIRKICHVFLLFSAVIRHSIQLLCPVFSRKVFFRCFEGRNQIWTTKTSPSSRQAWPPSDSCSSIARNTTCTALGNQWPVLRIAPFHLFLFTSGNDRFLSGNQNLPFQPRWTPFGETNFPFQTQWIPFGEPNLPFQPQ